MSAQLPPDANIPSAIYELATSHRLGTPLKRQRRRAVQIFLMCELLFCIALFGWLSYIIYGYIAFTILSHTYPNINSVPDNQLANYLWLQGLHDNLWLYTLQTLVPFLSLMSSSHPVFVAYRTKLYLCTDGLLKIYKKKDEVVRWYEVKELYTTNGKVTKLVRRDGSEISLPLWLLSTRGQTLNAVTRAPCPI